jgi:hypothetical protein
MRERGRGDKPDMTLKLYYRYAKHQELGWYNAMDINIFKSELAKTKSSLF